MEKDDFRDERKQLRRIERLARKEYKRMSRLEDNLLKSVPSSLIPGNVGEFDDVCWPFDYTLRFDFGVNPTWLPTTSQLQSFQVTQEAAFICGSLSRKCYSGTASGELAPLNVLIKDRQSTRQFMDFPIPLQAIAKKTPQTIWEVPLIFMPNAFVDVTLASFIDHPQPTVGNGVTIITFSGYRTRTQNIGHVLSTIFGKG